MNGKNYCLNIVMKSRNTNKNTLYRNKNCQKMNMLKNMNGILDEEKWNEWKELLFEYCNENKQIPTRKTIYKNKLIAYWFKNQLNKLGSSNDGIYKKMSENEYVKKLLDNYLKNKDGRLDKEKWNEWKNLLFEYCNENKRILTSKTIYKNKKIGYWYYEQKNNQISK